VNVEVAAKADELVAVIESERHPASLQKRVEALVEMLRPIADVVDAPEVRVFGADLPHQIAVCFGQRRGAAAVAGHGLRKLADHSSSRYCATCSDRKIRSMCVPSSKLSSAMNFSFAAYFMRTRWATSRWR